MKCDTCNKKVNKTSTYIIYGKQGEESAKFSCFHNKCFEKNYGDFSSSTDFETCIFCGEKNEDQIFIARPTGVFKICTKCFIDAGGDHPSGLPHK